MSSPLEAALAKLLQDTVNERCAAIRGAAEEVIIAFQALASRIATEGSVVPSQVGGYTPSGAPPQASVGRAVPDLSGAPNLEDLPAHLQARIACEEEMITRLQAHAGGSNGTLHGGCSIQ